MPMYKESERKVLSKDKRGSISSFKSYDEKGKSFELVRIETNPGFARGGETHTKKQHGIQVQGLAGWITKAGDHGKVYNIHELNTDFTVGAKVPHVYVAFTKSTMIKWLEGGVFEAKYDPEFRSIVTQVDLLEREIEIFKSIDRRVELALLKLKRADKPT